MSQLLVLVLAPRVSLELFGFSLKTTLCRFRLGADNDGDNKKVMMMMIMMMIKKVKLKHHSIPPVATIIFAPLQSLYSKKLFSSTSPMPSYVSAIPSVP